MTTPIPLHYTAGNETLGNFDPIPKGWYLGKIVEPEFKEDANDKEKSKIAYRIEVVDESSDFHGRQVFDDLMPWVVSNEKQANFQRKKMNTLLSALGLKEIRTFDELVGKLLSFRVTVDPARSVENPNTGVKTEYEARNKVLNFRSAADHTADPNAKDEADTLPAGFGQGNESKPAATATAPATSTRTQTSAPASAAKAEAPPAAPGDDFPPDGWKAHPTSPGWFYKGKEVLKEADLRAKYAPPAPPAAPEDEVPGIPGDGAGFPEPGMAPWEQPS